MKISFYAITKKMFDLIMTVLLATIFALPMLLIVILIKLESKGPALYWSKRIGANGKTFDMPKFRTMHINTPPLASHLLVNPEAYIIKVGAILRRTSLDELPQLWSIFIGQMSFVGPRPALFNQHDLISLRHELGVDILSPGLTGWAQINGRDSISLENKVALDCVYLKNRSFIFDLLIIWKTLLKVLNGSDINH